MKMSRKSVKRTIIGFLSLLFLLLLGVSYVNWQWNRVIVTVVNESGQDVDAVEIKLDNGGRYALGQLRAGASYSVRVFPHGEAAMRVEYFNEMSDTTRSSSDVYIESSGGYRPRLTIGKNGVVRCSYAKFLF